jgi:hypothetical protein
MSRGYNIGATVAALGAFLAACQPPADAPNVRIVVEREPQTTPPRYLVVSWISCAHPVVIERRVPEAGELTRGTDPVASIYISTDARDTSDREVEVRGMVAGTAVSMGSAKVRAVPGRVTEVRVRLLEQGAADKDGDGRPDLMDRCAQTSADAGARTDTGRSEATPLRPGEPTVNAGPDQVVSTVGGEAVLTGAASDDGLPKPPGRLTLAWSKVSGPGAVTFGDPRAAATKARFSEAGSYLLRLTADDGAATSWDDVTVDVLALEVGLVGHWRFDDGSGMTARDSTPAGNHATITGGAVWAAGRVGSGALDLASADEAVVPTPADGRLDFERGDFTLALWVKTGRIGEGRWPNAVAKAAADAPSSLRGYELIFTPDGLMQLRLRGGRNDVRVTATARIDDGGWHHVAGRNGGGVAALFVDGRLVAMRSHNRPSITSSGPLEFGGWSSRPINDFGGLLDDARIYGRALSDAEIAGLARGISP